MAPKLTDTDTDTAPANAEQAAAWDGDGGRFWADHADHFDTSVRAYQQTFMAAAAIQPDEQVLDVGCGAGQTSLDAARAATSGSVLGLDLSGPLLEVARKRAAAAGLVNVEFVQGDAQVHPFAPASFDVVLGRNSTMFFDDPPAAFAHLAHATKPGGRLVLLAWQSLADNEWFRSTMAALAAGRELPAPPPGAPGPFTLSDPDRVRTLLTGAGFVDPELRDLRAPMYLGRSPDEATQFVLGLNKKMLADLDGDTRTRAVEALTQTMRDHAGPDEVTFDSATWLITATRA
jgi:SAM-dependent methyltransferase